MAMTAVESLKPKILVGPGLDFRGDCRAGYWERPNSVSSVAKTSVGSGSLKREVPNNHSKLCIPTMNKVCSFAALLALLALIGSGPLVDGAVMNGTLTNPPFGMVVGLPSVGWTTHNPFINWMKLALPWGTGWGNYQDLLDDDHINIHGQVLSVPSNGIVTWVLFHLPEVSGATGRYRLTWVGTGTVVINGGSNHVYAPNRILFDYVANGENEVTIRITDVTAGPLRNFKLIHEDDWPVANLVFRPAWLDHIRNARILRFKDWQKIDNYDGGTQWSQRTRPFSTTFMMPGGVPPELMVDLCNMIGADCYFNMPHTVSTTYMLNFAKMALNRLLPERHVYVEYTNKVWDYAMSQAGYQNQQAGLLFNDSSFTAALSHYGGRSAEMAMAWKSIWNGANRPRLHTVLQVWTDNHWAEEFMLNAPNWMAAAPGRTEPKHHMTELAVHAIMDGGTSYMPDEKLDVVQNWIDTMTPTQFYDRMELACRFRDQAVDGGRTLEQEIQNWQYFWQIAADNNLNLMVYEGGSHIVTPYRKSNEQIWNDRYIGFHTSPQWANVYNDLINAWYSIVGPGNPFLHHNDMSMFGKYGSHGLARYIGDSNPQLTAFRTQEAARHGVSRGPNAFVGPFEIV